MSLDPQQHAPLAIARLAQYLKDKPNAQALLNAINAQSQAVENALQQVLTERALPVAVGDQLDQIGTLVGLARAGASDNEYRSFLYGWIKSNKSSGTAPQLLEIFQLIIAATPTYAADVASFLYPVPVLTLIDEPPASFVILINTATDATLAAFLLTVLRRSRAAGVGGRMQYGPDGSNDRFYFDGGLDHSSGLGFDNGTFMTQVM